MSFVKYQVLLLCVALSLWGIQWLLVGHAGLLSTILYSLIMGNIVTVSLVVASPLFDQPFPRDWIIFFAVLVPVTLVASVAGGVLQRLILGFPLRSLTNLKNGDVPFASLVGFVLGTGTHIYSSNRAKLQAANSQLAQQVQYGRQELAAQASELRDAFEIQSSLLPRTVPQIAGVEISCAWQPARTVSGDYFDVLCWESLGLRFAWRMCPARA